jgi:hypothetical protein
VSEHEEEIPSPRLPRDVGFSLELGGGFVGAARFPSSSEGRHVEEAVDSEVAIAALIGSSRMKFGLSLERTGLGKDHYATNASNDTVDATYLVDTLALLGRYYFSEGRPSVYLSLAGGPSVARVRATGTRATSDALVVPPTPYTCSTSGPVGGSIAAAIGGEFAVADNLTLAGEALFAGHFLSHSQSAFEGCAPATGSAFTGGLKLAIAYRFGS